MNEEPEIEVRPEPEQPGQREPTITVSASMKVNLGNYESADAYVGISGLPASATEEQIEELLATGKVAWSMVTKHLQERVQEMRSRRFQREVDW